MLIGETLEAGSRLEFREWLAQYHHEKPEIWLLIYKKSSGKQALTLGDAVEEALCYGWIDSYEKPVDSERYALRFSPRRPGSRWSDRNRSTALKLLREGKMAPAGMEALPAEIIEQWRGEEQG
ncbi:MAG: hypothetical protein EHM70_25450 [Chloroflexota bacterium]|nr:MAG: hypothetical protein EHM70_25450 [Chloroflexota bacterium]